MNYDKLYLSAKELLSTFKENSVYHTHMFQYQAVGSAVGIAIGIFADFFFPGSGKLVGMAITPIAIYTARKGGFKAWQNIVKRDVERGDYIYALQEAKKLYHSKLKLIERSKLSESRKLSEMEKAYEEYLDREKELTRNFLPNKFFPIDSIKNQNSIQQLIDNSNNEEETASPIKPKPGKLLRQRTKIPPHRKRNNLKT